MKKLMLFGVLLMTQQLMAQTDKAPVGEVGDGEQRPAGVLLAQMTQAADEASNITVIVEKKQTIEEYRQRGELVLVKVIPHEGVPYFIDPLERENLNGSGRDLINSGVNPVRWVLKEF